LEKCQQKEHKEPIDGRLGFILLDLNPVNLFFLFFFLSGKFYKNKKFLIKNFAFFSVSKNQRAFLS
jgi:hypothetical protein